MGSLSEKGAAVERAAVPAELRFFGPVFVVGIGRSGTKLLRDLLRGHPLIRIPPTESSLLPRWVADWHRFGDLSDRQRFAAFYRRAIQTKYCLLMEKHTGGPIPEDVWYTSCRGFGPADVFEALLRVQLAAPPETQLIWGDKSPDYTEHLPLLDSLYPHARFIHIVRDVRDCCLSAKNSWQGNMMRTAQRWADGVTKARHDGQLLPGRYLEVRYEDLLADPERELRRCCDLLGVEFDPSMLNLQYSTEHMGAAKGASAVMATNVRKFERLLDRRMRQRIEAIAAAALRDFGYDVDYNGPVRRVPRATMAYYRLLDAVNYVLARSKRNGFRRTLQVEFAKLARG
jgi:hypothetical protein